MQLNEKIHGFTVVRMRALPEIKATLYGLTHDGCGAELVYYDRDDDNKTFAISFGTPPQDDTGVFHIIEHSVLCGSERYPLKDPFAELLKGSLNTFLNAVTYEDRTVYPVSSRCERDFLNLVGVYMDAVTSPAMLKNPDIFKQEGWHYEYDKECDTLTYNGVVYNEMKGAYSSPDDVGEMELSRLLYADTPYGYDSGGDPLSIPKLTYEKFKEAHEKYYHLSGAKIVLDGKMDIKKALSLLDSYLSRSDRRECRIDFPTGTPKISPPKRVKYEISKNEDAAGRARILLGSVYSDYSDKEAHLTATVLSDVLCSTNASPLKKALIDRGLAKDAAVYTSRSRQQTVTIEIRDTDEECAEKIYETVESVIRELAKAGIGRERLSAVLNSIEFKLREQDHGSLPVGIANALASFGSWNYGGLPEDALLFEDAIASLRSKIDSGYFERELLKMTVDNPHRATVLMIPDKEPENTLAEIEKKALKARREAMSDGDIERIAAEEKALREWQDADESEEALASIPTLELSDISQKIEKIKTDESNFLGAKILDHRIETNGIVYISLYFDASDLTLDELSSLSILSAIYSNVPTDKRDVLTLQNDIKSNLGTLFTSTAASSLPDKAIPYLKLTASLLAKNCDSLLDIAPDVLLHSHLDDKKEIETVVAQIRSQIEDAIVSSGESVALARVEASVSAHGAVSEYMNGYELYKNVSELIGDSKKISALADGIARIAKTLICRERLTVSVAGDGGRALAERLISAIPSNGTEPLSKKYEPCAGTSEFFLIPSKIAYAVAGGRSDKILENLGFMRVARTVLSYEYLWSTVRVKNGAYGTGFIARRDGTLSFYSYRDPSPANSLVYFKESSEYLRELAKSDADITKFIIGTVGEFDILATPRTKAQIATTYALGGWSYEAEERVREQLLGMTARDLLAVADVIDEVLSDASVAVVGGSEHLGALPEKPKAVIEI